MNDRLLFQTSITNNTDVWRHFRKIEASQYCFRGGTDRSSTCACHRREDNMQTCTRTHKLSHMYSHTCTRTHAHTHTITHTHTHTHTHARTYTHTITITMYIVPLGYKRFAHTNTSLFTLLCQLTITAMNFMITKGCVSRSCCSMECAHKRHVSTFYYIWHWSRY